MTGKVRLDLWCWPTYQLMYVSRFERPVGLGLVMSSFLLLKGPQNVGWVTPNYCNRSLEIDHQIPKMSSGVKENRSNVASCKNKKIQWRYNSTGRKRGWLGGSRDVM